MSPDRTYAALRREVYLRKPEVFKMACLRDIMSLFQPPSAGLEGGGVMRTPFYAGFGNRITDAMSYRSVSIPSTRIFTINSNAEVSMHLLASDQYRTSYVTMRELVDHYFPPVGLLVKEGGEEYTDFNYWRDRPLEIDEFSASESGSDYDEDYDADARPSIEESIRSEDDHRDAYDETDMDQSFYSRASLESAIPGMEESTDPSLDSSMILEDEMVSFPPETPAIERMAAFDIGNEEDGGVEVEIDDPSNELGALDLAAEATPHVKPADKGGLMPEGLEELTRVVSSPERVDRDRGT